MVLVCCLSKRREACNFFLVANPKVDEGGKGTRPGTLTQVSEAGGGLHFTSELQVVDIFGTSSISRSHKRYNHNHHHADVAPNTAQEPFDFEQ